MIDGIIQVFDFSRREVYSCSIPTDGNVKEIFAEILAGFGVEYETTILDESNSGEGAKGAELNGS